MPEYRNPQLIQQRLRSLSLAPNPFTNLVQPVEEEEEVLLPPTPQQPVMDAPRLQTIAPSAEEQRYAELAGAPPTQAQYAPGKLRRLAAILSGMSAGIQQGGGAGAQTARSILAAPYQQARTEWQDKIAALEPSIKLQQSRAAMGQRQYGTDVARYNAELNRMSASELNSHRTATAQEVARHNKALEAYREGEVPRALQIEADKAKNRLTEIDRRTAGQVKVENVRQTGAESRFRRGEEGRERRFGQGEAGKTERAREREAGLDRRSAERRTDLPYRKGEELEKEAIEATRLVDRNPVWEEFVDRGGGIFNKNFKLKSISEVPKEKQLEYQKFIRQLDRRMSRESYTLEPLDDEEESFEEEEE